MLEHIFLLVFVVWVVAQSFFGWRKGLWLCLLDIAALVLAYLVSFFFGEQLTNYLSQFPSIDTHARFIAYPSLFIVVNSVLPFVLKHVFPALKRRSLLLSLAGAGVGGATGAVMALLAVWFVGIGMQTMGIEQPGLELGQQAQPLKKAASSLVSEATELGLRATGADPAQAQVMASIVAEPESVIQSVKELSKSEPLKHLVRNKRIQRMMATNDASSLAASDEFQQLVQDPAMSGFLNKLEQSGKHDQAAQTFLAEQFSFVWRRMLYTQNDPRVQSLFDDQQWRESLAQKNPAQLMADSKFQQLVSVILESRPELKDADLSYLLDKELAADLLDGPEVTGLGRDDKAAKRAVKPYRSTEVYKWVDDQGVVQYSQWSSIPESKRASAQRLMR
ncbi:CvpA family protein [Agaribacterium sp. ZY112]|uniref:CvpA family protein n=1 Tax=Agaribacterium sp. ZY112 TaxID=3233574 RepID=UPI0035261081